MKNLSVTLRMFYGEVNYDKDGNVKSRNETVSITFGSPEWDNFIKHIKSHGVTSVKIEKVFDLSKVNEKEPVESLNRYQEVEDYSDVATVINKLFDTADVALTPEQKQIKELKEKLAALESSQAGVKSNEAAAKDTKNGLSKGGVKSNEAAVKSGEQNQ